MKTKDGMVEVEPLGEGEVDLRSWGFKCESCHRQEIPRIVQCREFVLFTFVGRLEIDTQSQITYCLSFFSFDKKTIDGR